MAISKDQISFLKTFSIDHCQEAAGVLYMRMMELRNPKFKEIRKYKIHELNLSERSYNVLINNNFNTVGQVLDYGLGNVSNLKGSGKKTTQEIITKVVGFTEMV